MTKLKCAVLVVLVCLGLESFAGGLPAGITHIDGINENLPSADLQPLKTLIGNSPIVGLGESVHTSGGYYQTKFRLIKFLIEEMGFRTLAFETPWLDALITTQYVATCKGDPVKAIGGVFSVFQSQETLKMFQWVCAFNMAHPNDKVSFYGFDMQEMYNQFKFLTQFFDRALPAKSGEIMGGLKRCVGGGATTADDFYRSEDGQNIQNRRQVSNPSRHQECLVNIASAKNLVRRMLSSSRPAQNAQFAVLALIGYEAAENQYFLFFSDYPGAFVSRDRGMAQIFVGLRKILFPRNRTIIWAHNDHLAAEGFDIKVFGSFLKDVYHRDYFPIGLEGYKVGINWGSYPQPPLPPVDSFQERLHRFGEKYLLVDTEKMLRTPVILGQSTRILAQRFRALFYLDYSPPRILIDKAHQ